MTPTGRQTNGLSPEQVIRQGGAALGYLSSDPSLDVTYELGAGTVVTSECQAFLSKANIAEAFPAAYLSIPSRQLWKRMLGEATALAIEGDLDSAEKILTEANKFLGDRASEAARMWYVQGCFVLIAALVSVYVLVGWWFQHTAPSVTEVASKLNLADRLDDIYTIKYILLAAIGGAVGAGFSLLVRVGSLPIDPAAGRQSHYGEVAFRMTIGALAGFIIIVGWQAGLFATFAKAEAVAAGEAAANAVNGTVKAMRASPESFVSDFWKMTIMALAAGASERLVPSLLRQLSDRTIAEGATPTVDPPADE